MRTLQRNWRTGPLIAVAQDGQLAPWLDGIAEIGDVEDLFARQAEGLPGLPDGQFQGQDAHTHQVAAVDALEADGQHGPHA